jgi:hypothetical protein
LDGFARCCAACILTKRAAHTHAIRARNQQQIKPDFSNFDESGAWPYLVDEFVDHMKQKSGMQVD